MKLYNKMIKFTLSFSEWFAPFDKCISSDRFLFSLSEWFVISLLACELTVLAPVVKFRVVLDWRGISNSIMRKIKSREIHQTPQTFDVRYLI